MCCREQTKPHFTDIMNTSHKVRMICFAHAYRLSFKRGRIFFHHNPKQQRKMNGAVPRCGKTHVQPHASRQSKLWSEESFNSVWSVSPETGIIRNSETTSHSHRRGYLQQPSRSNEGPRAERPRRITSAHGSQSDAYDKCTVVLSQT